ncbi:MAG: DUF3313 family protein [Xanthomonadales bacterium]|nr:DUF3313 family protein [Xanthomonadales bacterium]
MKLKKIVYLLVLLTATVFLTATLMSGPVFAKDKLPEVDSDGLHLVKKSKVKAAYIKPGTDLTQYSKVKLLDCYVDFVKNWERDYNMNQLGLEGRVRDKDAEKIKTRLAAEFAKEFTKVLTEKGFPVVDEVGPDVLLLRPALINVDVVAPDIMTADMRSTFVSSAGSMTLYMEMYDSATSTLIARVVDPRADDEGFAQRANRVTNKAAADRMLRHWAELLAKHLGEVTK